MSRAKTELIMALAVTLGFVVFLAWYQGQRAGTPAASAALSGTIARTAPEMPALEVANTTLLAGGLPGTVHEAPAPEVPATVLERDREFIAEAFPALSSWSVAEVKPLLSTAALNASTDAELAQVMTTLSDRLGTLQYFDAPEPVSGPEALEYPNSTASLQPYSFTAYYEAGAAEVNLVLEKQQQHSALYSFDIHIQN